MLQPHIEFAWDELFQLLGESSADQDEITRWKILHSLVHWLAAPWQTPANASVELNGLKCRAVILAWIVLKDLQGLSIRQLAERYGVCYVSLNRAHQSFMKVFPEVTTMHMRIKTSAAFRAVHRKEEPCSPGK
jgi:hypothetical protein